MGLAALSGEAGLGVVGGPSVGEPSVGELHADSTKCCTAAKIRPIFASLRFPLPRLAPRPLYLLPQLTPLRLLLPRLTPRELTPKQQAV